MNLISASRSGGDIGVFVLAKAGKYLIETEANMTTKLDIVVVFISIRLNFFLPVMTFLTCSLSSLFVCFV